MLRESPDKECAPSHRYVRAKRTKNIQLDVVAVKRRAANNMRARAEPYECERKSEICALAPSTLPSRRQSAGGSSLLLFIFSSRRRAAAMAKRHK